MAITNATQEVTVIGVKDLPSSLDHYKRDVSELQLEEEIQHSIVSSDESTCTSSDASSSAASPCRKRRPRKKKAKQQHPQGRRSSKSKNTEVPLSLDEQAQYIALDCEMVGVGHRGNISSVARVTLVGWNGETLYDEFIRQDQEVTDYRTFVSGITAEDLTAENEAISLELCRAQLSRLLEGKILIGHALKNDLKALGMQHPWHQTRDTAKYEPFQQVRFAEDGILWPRKLKDLAHEKLQRDIQVPGQPHSAYEDALAALDLYRLVRRKWEKAMDYKILKTKEIEQRKEK